MKKRTVIIAAVLIVLAMAGGSVLAACDNKEKPDTSVQDEKAEEKEKEVDIKPEETKEEPAEEVDNTMLNVDTSDAVSYSSIPAPEKEEEPAAPAEEEGDVVSVDIDKVIAEQAAEDENA